MIVKKFQDIYYSSRMNNKFTFFSEYWLHKSEVQLDKDRFGFLDNNLVIPFLQFTTGTTNQVKRSIDDPMNGNKDDLIVYFNFVMDNQAVQYRRKHYSFLDLLKESGGLIKQIAIFAVLILKPFTFKRHELEVFQDHVEKHDKKQFDENQKVLRKYDHNVLPTEFFIYLNERKKMVMEYFKCFANNNDKLTKVDIEEPHINVDDLKIEDLDELMEKMTEIKLSIYDMQSLSNFIEDEQFLKVKLEKQQEEINAGNVFQNYLLETVT